MAEKVLKMKLWPDEAGNGNVRPVMSLCELENHVSLTLANFLPVETKCCRYQRRGSLRCVCLVLHSSNPSHYP